MFALSYSSFPRGRYEGVYHGLVGDMSNQELAMRAITKNAELLIFPSTELPMKYWSELHTRYPLIVSPLYPTVSKF